MSGRKHSIKYLHLKSCSSTQDRIQLVQSGWFLIWSDSQTDGRGTNQRRWQSPAGGLYYSLAFPASSVSYADPLVLLGAAFVWKRLLMDWYPDISDELTLKWPNDLLHGGRKLAGFLAQKQSSMFYLGVGLNVNNPLADEDESLRRPAISLTEITGQQHSRRDLLLEWSDRFKRAVSSSASDVFEIGRLEEHLSTIGAPVTLEGKTGTARGLGESGELEVLVNGTVRKIHSAEDVEVSVDEARG